MGKSLLDRWLEKGIEQGKREGIQQGIAKGEAELLLRQLRRKFGELDAETIERVERAEPEQLLHWGERILTAATLGEVFENSD